MGRVCTFSVPPPFKQVMSEKNSIFYFQQKSNNIDWDALIPGLTFWKYLYRFLASLKNDEKSEKNTNNLVGFLKYWTLDKI